MQQGILNQNSDGLTSLFMLLSTRDVSGDNTQTRSDQAGSSNLGNISNISNSDNQINTKVTTGSAEKKSVRFNDAIDILYFDKSENADDFPKYKLEQNVRMYRRLMDYCARQEGLFFAAGHDHPYDNESGGYDHQYALSKMALLEGQNTL